MRVHVHVISLLCPYNYPYHGANWCIIISFEVWSLQYGNAVYARVHPCRLIFRSSLKILGYIQNLTWIVSNIFVRECVQDQQILDFKIFYHFQTFSAFSACVFMCRQLYGSASVIDAIFSVLIPSSVFNICSPLRYFETPSLFVVIWQIDNILEKPCDRYNLKLTIF